MNKVYYKGASSARLTSRMRQVVVLFLAVVAGILVSVSINF
jgi:hypothetical protein